MKKAIVGSVLAAGVAASLFGAGSAAAAPGVSFDPGTGGKNTIGIGDQKPGSGAYANASKGNTALAVNLGLSPKGTVATANNSGTGNNVFAFEGTSVVTDGVAPGAIKPNNNNVGTIFGGTVLAGGQGNSIVNGGGLITAFDGQSENQTSVSFCGTRVTAQSAHIVPGKAPGGLC